MSDPKPTRHQGDLAEMLDTLLDKGVVINADIAVSVGDTELLGVKLRAAVASFETAAEYGLEFPSGTDMERVAAASDRSAVPDGNRDAVDPPIRGSDPGTAGRSSGTDPGLVGQSQPDGAGTDDSRLIDPSMEVATAPPADDQAFDFPSVDEIELDDDGGDRE